MKIYTEFYNGAICQDNIIVTPLSLCDDKKSP